MKLILIRHAKAEDREKWGGQDNLQRPLTKKGKKQAKQIAKYLLKHHANIHAIISSLALRANDTAKPIANEFPQATYFLTPTLNPNKSIHDLEHTIQEHKQYENIVLVGHEPMIGDFLAACCFGGYKPNIKISKACMIVLQTQDHQNWQLIELRNLQ